jgi:hypothetical protein
VKPSPSPFVMAAEESKGKSFPTYFMQNFDPSRGSTYNLREKKKHVFWEDGWTQADRELAFSVIDAALDALKVHQDEAKQWITWVATTTADPLTPMQKKNLSFDKDVNKEKVAAILLGMPSNKVFDETWMSISVAIASARERRRRTREAIENSIREGAWDVVKATSPLGSEEYTTILNGLYQASQSRRREVPRVVGGSPPAPRRRQVRPGRRAR